MENIYGNTIQIDNCLIGGNLNLGVVRGFGSLAILADVSSADVFDQEKNPFGTQRDLSSKHSSEATTYALDSLSVDGNIDPRAFPEVVLNVRDTSIVKVLKDGHEIDFASQDLFDGHAMVVSLVIHTSQLKWPQEKFDPQISRVDGNHRLSKVPAAEERESEHEFPVIPFALFVGLSKDQEKKLFRDINGNQQKMTTSHLDQIAVSLDGDGLLADAKSRGLWIAKQLGSSGRVFDGMVYQGGAKSGVKEATGAVPPISLSTLKSMVSQTLSGMPGVVVEMFDENLMRDVASKKMNSADELRKRGNQISQLIEKFWLAVKEHYPEAWQDRKNHILLQSIGLMSLSQFAAQIISECITERNIAQEAFSRAISDVKAAGFTFEKDRYPGIAGAAGAKKVFGDLTEAKSQGGNGLRSLLDINEKSEGSSILDS